MSASCLLEIDERERAKTMLTHAVSVSPDNGHTKYMSLAQMCEGQDAVNYYRKGIDILTKEIETVSVNSVEKSAVLNRELSDAYCALSEIFTTDLCDEADAEEQCVSNIDKAISIDPKNPEGYLCKANYLFIKQELQEAKTMMQKSLSLWLPQMRAVLEGQTDIADPVDVCSLPYNSRINTVKLLLEMEDYEEASEVLELLLTENDSDVEVWYLLGLSNYLQGENFKTNARYYFKKAQKVSKKTGVEEPTIMEHIDAMLAELGPGNPDEDDDDSSSDEKENTNVNNDSDDSIAFSSNDENEENAMET